MADVLLNPALLTPVEGDDENDVLYGPAARVAQVQVEPPEIEEGELVAHARRELERAGLFKEDSDYGGMLGDEILGVVERFSAGGHSGMSAMMSVAALEKLLRFEPLTPLTSEPEEWMHIADERTNGRSVWQSKRDPRAFSYDGGKTWEITEAAVEAVRRVALSLEEAFVKKFDEKKHPRWPKGTPKAGQFMRKGDWFERDGKVWQIVSTAGGRVEAVEASGKPKAVEHRVFDTDFDAVDGPGVAVPGVVEAKPQKFDRNTSPVVIPYVDPASHDPQIKRPANATVSEEEWKRFGRDDQAYYVELMERFGEWKPSAAKSTMAQVYGAYSSKVQQVVTKAYAGNKGGSGFWSGGAGQWLNLAWLLKNVSANPKTAWDAYKEAKVAFDEISEVVHWDLFNRTRAPDITLFHGGARSVDQVHNEHIAGDKPIYAGYSQSYSLSGSESWGSTVLMTPTAIKHVAMSYYTPLPGGSSNWGELEIAVGVRMALDERSVVFNSSSYGVTDPTAKQAISKWLHGQTGNNPAGGQMVEELKKTWSGEGGIPIPPPAFDKVPMATGAKQYEELPDEVAKAALEAAKTAKYKSEDGTKEGAVGKIDGMGLKPGDLIEGKQGARYVIIEDAGDDSNGLRYVSVIRSNGAENFPIDYGKSFAFGASAGNDFYRLDAHIEIPKKKAVGFVPFTAEQYDQLVPGEKTKLGEMALGDMFKEEGEGFKIAGAGPTGTVLIESLETGKKFKANRLFKAVPLVPKEGFVPPTSIEEEPPYEPQEGELVRATTLGALAYYAGASADGNPEVIASFGKTPVPPGTLQPFEKPAPDAVEPGDIFGHNGVKYTVTSVLKDGTVRAKPPGGKVEKFPASEVGAGDVFRPGDWQIEAKQKAKTLSAGDLISASPAKVRPYLVMGVMGKEAHLLNLETGEQSKVSANKSYNALSKAALKAEPEVPDPTPKKPETTLPPLEPNGTKAVLNTLAEGTTFLFGSKQYVVTVEADESGIGKGKQILDDGTYGPEMPWGSGGTQEVLLLYPKAQQTSDFDQSKYAEGPLTKLKDAEAGTVFLSATGIPMQLKSTTPKGGATAVALHNGKLVKNISYEKDFTTLVPKVDAPFDYDQLAAGDPVPLEKLKDGDWFKWGYEGHAWQAVTVTPGAVEAKKLIAPNTLAEKSSFFGPGTEVTFHAHAADGPKLSADPQPQADPPNVDALPEVAEYTTYMHAKSGTKKYPHLGDMQVGTFFKDKAGKKWLVKANEGGAWVAITDGQENFKASTALRGNVSEDVLFHDSSPPLGGPSPLTASYVADLALTDNSAGVTLGQMALVPGDQFQTPTGVWSVQAHLTVQQDGWISATHVGTGETKTFGPLVVPDAFSKSKPAAAVGTLVTSTEILDRLPVGATVKHSNPELSLVYTKQANGKWQTESGSEFAASAFPTSAPDVYEVASVPEAADVPDVEAEPEGPKLALGGAALYGKDEWLSVAKNLTPDALDMAVGALSDEDLAVAAAWADEAGANNVTVAVTVEQAKRAPKPRAGLDTTAEALEAGFYEEAGPKLPSADLPNMALARTAGGKVIYKFEGVTGGMPPKWFELGGDKKLSMKPTTKVTPLTVTHPDSDEFVDAGEAVLGDLFIGQAFGKTTGAVATTYVVIGKGEAGMHFLNTDTGVVLFSAWDQANNVKVMRRDGPGVVGDPEPPEATPEQKAFFAQLSNGDKALYVGGGVDTPMPLPVTVTDNQIAGTGVMVADEKGQQIVAHAGELLPPEDTPVISDFGEEPPLGEGQSELSPLLEPNESGMKLAELPVGAVYAYLDEDTGGYDVKKIVVSGPDPEAEVGMGAGVLAKPSGTYVPEFIWLPRGAASGEKKPLTKMKVGTQFVGADGETYTVTETDPDYVAYEGPEGEHTEYDEATLDNVLFTVVAVPGEGDEPELPAEVKPVSEFEHGSHAWSLGGKHGIVKVSPTSLEKGFYMDEGGPPIFATELYVRDPMGGPTPPKPLDDPDLWVKGDVVAGEKGTGSKSVVVEPLSTSGTMKLKHLEPEDVAGKEYSLHKSALTNTYSYEKVGFTVGDEAGSSEATTFGALPKGTQFTTPTPGTPSAGTSGSAHHTPATVFTSMGTGSEAGWAKAGTGGDMKFSLSHPVVPVAGSATASDSYDALQVGAYFEAHGGLWQKAGGGKAKPVLPVTDAGLQGGWKGEQVTAVAPEKAHGMIAGVTAPAEDSEATFPEVGDWVVFNMPLGTGVGKVTGDDPENHLLDVVTPEGEALAVAYDDLEDDDTGMDVAALDATLAANTTSVLVAGEKWLDASGSPFTVTAVDPGDGAAKITFDNGHTITVTAGEAKNFVSQGLWKRTGKTVTASSGDPLKPYLHPKSGTYKYDQIGTLAPGTKFTDKSKKSYVVVGQVGDQTLFEDADGKQFSTAKKSRVKVTEAAPPVEEARVAFTSGGAVRIAA